MRQDTEVLADDDVGLERAAELIRQGQCVAVATETVYGLAADARDPLAVGRVYQAKQRPATNPLIVHVATFEEATQLGKLSAPAISLAQRHWPGPLTLVTALRHGNGIASGATGPEGTIALRCPAASAMRRLLEICRFPLVAPSANASGRLSPTRAQHVLASLDGRIAAVVDSGATPLGIESTVIDGRDPSLPVLRPGSLDVGSILESVAVGVSPGQLNAHYAPLKELRLNATSAEADEWLIGFGARDGTSTLSRSGDLAEAASTLFTRLHEADFSPMSRIAVASIPDEGIGRAINDRLRRAASR